MTTDTADTAEGGRVAPAADPGFLQRYGTSIEYILIPGAALVGALATFGAFVALYGKNPLDLYFYMYQGAFGTWFSRQNTLTRAAPLILTALCTALPAQLGMVIIGGEGRVADRRAVGYQRRAGAASGIAAGRADRDGDRRRDRRRAVDHAVGRAAAVSRRQRDHLEPAAGLYRARGPQPPRRGVMRDPASLNKPSTREIGAANMIGSIPGTDVHWGLVFGLVCAIAAYILIYHTTFGFAARVAGGNIRAAKIVGLGVGKLILTHLLSRRRLRRPRRHDRGRRGAGPHQREPRRRLRLHRPSSSPSWRGRIRWR